MDLIHTNEKHGSKLHMYEKTKSIIKFLSLFFLPHYIIKKYILSIQQILQLRKEKRSLTNKYFSLTMLDTSHI